MSGSKQMKMTQRNLIWLALIAIVAAASFLVAGWQLALGAAVVVLVVSEAAERTRRRGLHRA